MTRRRAGSTRPTDINIKMADTSVAPGTIPGLDGEIPQDRYNLGDPYANKGGPRPQQTNHDVHQTGQSPSQANEVWTNGVALTLLPIWDHSLSTTGIL